MKANLFSMIRGRLFLIILTSALRFTPGYGAPEIRIHPEINPSGTNAGKSAATLEDCYDVTAPTLSAYSVCVGQEITVSFNWKNNSCQRDASRRFRYSIFLSDPTGDFMTPGAVLLGSFDSPPGTYKVKLPASAAAGSSYRLLIRSSELFRPNDCPVAEFCPDEVRGEPVASMPSGLIQINSNPLVTASNNGPFLEGQPILLKASGGNTYQWNGPAGFTSKEQNPTIPNARLSMAGAYSVTADNGCGTASATTNVAVSVNFDPVYDCQMQLLTISTSTGNDGTLEYKVKEYADRYFSSNTFALSQALFAGKKITVYVRHKGTEQQKEFTVPVCSPIIASPLVILDPAYDCRTQMLTIRTSGGDGSRIEYKVVEYADRYYTSQIFLLSQSRFAGKKVTVFVRQQGVEQKKEVTLPNCTATASLLPSAEASGKWQSVLHTNPVADEVTFSLLGAEGQMVRLMLTDVSGKVIMDRTVAVKNAYQEEQLSIAAQKPGIYVLRLSSARQAMSHKVLKR